MTGPQSDRHRVVVVGHLHPTGGDCTVMFERVADGWLLHLFGIVRGSVRLTLADARVIANGLRAT